MIDLLATYAAIRARVTETSDGCHEWSGAKTVDGYGQVRVGGKLYATHRVAYEAVTGPIPDRFQIDHLCRNPRCCNPAHLEAVTREENIRRGNIASATSTHCAKGHPYSAENTGTAPNGNRFCRQCRRARTNRNSRIRRAKLKEAQHVQ